jgi:hypothetical protein
LAANAPHCCHAKLRQFSALIFRVQLVSANRPWDCAAQHWAASTFDFTNAGRWRAGRCRPAALFDQIPLLASADSE